MASVVQSEAETFSSDATKYLGNQSLAETDEINAMQAEIESLQEELADLAKQEEQLKLQEEYALLQKYLQLSQVVKERDSEREAFLLNRENMTKKFYADIEEAHREIETLEREVARAESDAMDEAKKLETAQTHFKQLRVALLIEMAQHEQQLEQMDSQLARLQEELDSSDAMSAGIRERIKEDVRRKWTKVIDEEKQRMANELAAAKAEADRKLADVKETSEERAQKQFAPAMRALREKLAHETAVREEWQNKATELEREIAVLEVEHKDVIDEIKSANAATGSEEKKKAEFDKLRATVQALWEILEVDDEEALSFMMAVQELAAFSPAALALYQQEEQRLLQMKAER